MLDKYDPVQVIRQKINFTLFSDVQNHISFYGQVIIKNQIYSLLRFWLSKYQAETEIW